MTKTERIPQELKDRRRWVLWRGPKIPYQAGSRKPASTTNPDHWAGWEVAEAAYEIDDYSGLGYVFHRGDGLVGIDIDDCRDPKTGLIHPVAQEIIDTLASYAEVSPSGTGVKIWCKGSIPAGRKFPMGLGMQIEFYSEGRYFCVTGESLGNLPVRECNGELTRIYRRYQTGNRANDPDREEPQDITALDLCRLAVRKIGDSVSGDRGSDRMLHVCCETQRHGLDDGEAWEIIHEYNERAVPPWSQRELTKKLKDAKRKVLEDGTQGEAVEAATVEKWSLEPVDLVDFLQREYKLEFLVDGILVAGQPSMLGGPHKSLKTSIAIELGLAIATGGRFLGEFQARQAPALLVSGESGAATIQETCRRIMGARGMEPGEALRGQFTLSFELPRLSLKAHLEELEKEIVRLGAKWCGLDPAYLCLLQKAEDASNVFAMGSVLKGLSAISQRTGCTITLLHHTKKPTAGSLKSPPDLTDLAFTGFSEWARQWLLVKPRQEYRNGRHKLWLAVGGSAGHYGQWFLSVNEGLPALTGRLWETSLEDVDTPDDTADGSEDEVLTELLEAYLGRTGGATVAEAAKAIGKRKAKVREALAALVESGVVESLEKKTESGQKATVYHVNPLR